MTPSLRGWEAFPTPGALTHTRITWALSPPVPQVPCVTPGSPCAHGVLDIPLERCATTYVGLVTHVLYTILYASQAIVLVKKTSALTPLYWIFWISRIMHNLHNVPIGLRIVRHEAYEGWMWDIVAMTWLRLCQKKIWASISSDWKSQHDGHDPLLSPIVHMRDHVGPPFDLLHVIGHHPHVLKVATRLHS